MTVVSAPPGRLLATVVEGPRVTRGYLVRKRMLDVLVGLPLTIVCVPVMSVVSLAILLGGGLPILFVQERVGARPELVDGRIVWELRRFRLFKFRTMRQGSEQTGVHEAFVRSFLAGELSADPQAAAAFKLADDPRITRVGRWLRATSLDELPQLFNVLLGDMSLVGPRPVPFYEVDGYAERHVRRLAATPGMTGIWQVHGRGRVSFEEMVQMDIEYVERRSLRLDITLLLLTLPSVLNREGAR